MSQGTNNKSSPKGKKCNFCDNIADVIDEHGTALCYRCEIVEPWKVYD